MSKAACVLVKINGAATPASYPDIIIVSFCKTINTHSINIIRQINNNIWIATAGYGLWKYSGDSLFNITEYSGPYVPWCLGGCGYIISRNSLKILSTDTNYHNEIYEDLYVAKILYDKQINPTNVSDLSRYIYSKDHS